MTPEELLEHLKFRTIVYNGEPYAIITMEIDSRSLLVQARRVSDHRSKYWINDGSKSIVFGPTGLPINVQTVDQQLVHDLEIWVDPSCAGCARLTPEGHVDFGSSVVRVHERQEWR